MAELKISVIGSFHVESDGMHRSAENWTPKERELLAALAIATVGGRKLQAKQLFRMVWGVEYDGANSKKNRETFKTHVNNVRTYLHGPGPENKKLRSKNLKRSRDDLVWLHDVDVDLDRFKQSIKSESFELSLDIAGDGARGLVDDLVFRDGDHEWIDSERDSFLKAVDRRFASQIELELRNNSRLAAKRIAERGLAFAEIHRVVALIESAEKRLDEVVNGLETGDATESTSRSGPVDLASARSAYLSSLQGVVQGLHFSRTGLSNKKLALSDVYAPTPTRSAISVEACGGRVRRWQLSLLPNNARTYRMDRGAAVPIEEIDDPTNSLVQALIPSIEAALADGVDPDYSEPVPRPLALSPPWLDGTKWNYRPLYVSDLIVAHPRLVVLGAPGSGKSTAARHIAIERAVSLMDSEEESDTLVSPVYVTLSDFVKSTSFLDNKELPIVERFWAYVKDTYCPDDYGAAVEELFDEFRGGRVALILDGLDEIPDVHRLDSSVTNRQQIERLISGLAAIEPEFILITSRIDGYSHWEIPGFEVAELAPLRNADIERIGRAFFETIRSGPPTVSRFLIALEPIPDSLKDRPLFVNLMASVFAKRDFKSADIEVGLPPNRGALFRESLHLLLERWTIARFDQPSLDARLRCTPSELYDRLRAIAFLTQTKSATTDRADQIDLADLVRELFQLESEPETREVLTFLSKEAGVLVSPSPNEYEFAHRGFQEYLSASHLTTLENGAELLRSEIVRSPITWREPGLMIGDTMDDDRCKLDVWDFVEALVMPAEGCPVPNHESLWLASQLLVKAITPEARERPRNVALVEESRRQFANVLEGESELEPVRLAEIAESLGVLGDDRVGVGCIDRVPEHAWVAVPGGPYSIGATSYEIEALAGASWASSWSFAREQPSHGVKLTAFEIAKYPVTVEQFDAFLRDEDGYRNTRWWSKAGRAWRERAGDRVESDDRRPNLPITGVSWYEASAYCKWLSSKTSEKIRLPTEAEWEVAARGPEGLCFPWGNEFDMSACNSNLANINRVIPVGATKQGQPPWLDGPLDMAGNVWEWCSTIAESTDGQRFGYPYDSEDGRESIARGDSWFRIVRGGSFVNAPFNCRNGFRGRDLPGSQFARQGFRVARSIA